MREDWGRSGSCGVLRSLLALFPLVADLMESLFAGYAGISLETGELRRLLLISAPPTLPFQLLKFTCSFEGF